MIIMIVNTIITIICINTIIMYTYEAAKHGGRSTLTHRRLAMTPARFVVNDKLTQRQPNSCIVVEQFQARVSQSREQWRPCWAKQTRRGN